jgi:hypothetical protein
MRKMVNLCPKRVDLERHARQLVDDAHRIARLNGEGNVLSILKEMVVQEIRRR